MNKWSNEWINIVNNERKILKMTEVNLIWLTNALPVMNEYFVEWLKLMKWLISERMNEWRNKWMNGWMNEWMFFIH